MPGRTKRNAPPMPALPGLSLPDDVLPAGPRVVGIDEVGRGCLAGPVVACAVILPDGFKLDGLDDSKKLTPEKREHLAPLIKSMAEAWSLGIVWPCRIDSINILQATFEAMAHALGRVLAHVPAARGRQPYTVLVDGNKTIPESVLSSLPGCLAGIRQKSVVKGDSLSPAISAASVLAKVWRDSLMVHLSKKWPGYGFEIHKGYGTKAHYEALEKLGPCPMHRLSFHGVSHGASNDVLHGVSHGTQTAGTHDPLLISR